MDKIQFHREEIRLNFSNYCNSSHKFSDSKHASELWYVKFVSIKLQKTKNLASGKVLFLLLNNEALANFSTRNDLEQ